MRQKSRLWRAMYQANSQPCVTKLIVLWKSLIRLFQTLKLNLTKFCKTTQSSCRISFVPKMKLSTQTAVLENLPLTKPPQQTENNTTFHDSPHKDVNQLNKNVIFKSQANQEYNNQSQHHVVNTQYHKVSKQQKRNHYQKSKQEKRRFIGNLNKDVKEQDLVELFGFNATTYLQENCCVDLPTGKN